ncbi:MAG: phenylalanine--tRNA ligase subunit alpha, partial [Clostridia bacterium]|nr:phenylalanine--tRNA ligase subunit alpha [Clostridia bacterium]
MKEKLKDITSRALSSIEKATSNQELNQVRVEILGKSGELTAILRNMKELPADERPMAGKLVNEARTKIEEALDKKVKKISALELAKKLEEEKIDITIDKPYRAMGGLHPITKMRDAVTEFFTSLGF